MVQITSYSKKIPFGYWDHLHPVEHHELGLGPALRKKNLEISGTDEMPKFPHVFFAILFL